MNDTGNETLRILLVGGRFHNDFLADKLVLDWFSTEGIAVTFALGSARFASGSLVLHQAPNTRPSIRQTVTSSQNLKQVRHIRKISRVVFDFFGNRCNVRKLVLIVNVSRLSIVWLCNVRPARHCVREHGMICHENKLVVFKIVDIAAVSTLGCLDSVMMEDAEGERGSFHDNIAKNTTRLFLT